MEIRRGGQRRPEIDTDKNEKSREIERETKRMRERNEESEREEQRNGV